MDDVTRPPSRASNQEKGGGAGASGEMRRRREREGAMRREPSLTAPLAASVPGRRAGARAGWLHRLAAEREGCGGRGEGVAATLALLYSFPLMPLTCSFCSSPPYSCARIWRVWLRKSMLGPSMTPVTKALL